MSAATEREVRQRRKPQLSSPLPASTADEGRTEGSSTSRWPCGEACEMRLPSGQRSHPINQTSCSPAAAPPPMQVQIWRNGSAGPEDGEGRVHSEDTDELQDQAPGTRTSKRRGSSDELGGGHGANSEPHSKRTRMKKSQPDTMRSRSHSTEVGQGCGPTLRRSSRLLCS